ncbi:glycerol-3-phosphate dehydrogenase [Natronoarchaeum philippinense]|uniref:Glycerol-3-phosphate dehydrogenase n=1 Tax=Natronoarchaeum philippinense TaxID=558529 RepID=A0A285P3T9_NATPI|nr:FAD-dependent oxidoreductase [Natronoarchaeum philippinense]SNZ16118.1 glycerol-3-phosphate dehydrogenase [Natronoarchaeum philippinense]
MERTDVLVVGGGGTGTGIVRDLAMRGLDTTLVDRGGLGSGTTGRSHGLLHSGARYAEADATGARECIAENEILREIAGECIAETGGLFVQLDADDPAYFDAKRDACREHGIPAEELTPAEAQDEVPDLTDDVERALSVPDGVIYPSRLVAATAADARAHGARILPDAPVTDLLIEDDAVVGAAVDHEVGEIRADHVVNATGAWADQLGSMAGVDLDMKPTRGVMIGVEYSDLGPVLNRCRPPDDGDIVVPHGEQVVLGTTSVAVEDPDDYEQAEWEVERTVEECAAMLPSVADAEQTRTYWGVRPLYGPEEDELGDERGISRGFFVVDHADRDGLDGFTSVVGGKLTTHRLMAEAAVDHIAERLGVDAACRTAEEQLTAHDDPDRLDALVEEFDAAGPADADVVGRR